MTIKPQETRELNEDEKEEVRRLEKSIDKRLMESDSEYGITVDIQSTRPKVYKELIRMYDLAGWKVRYQSDQRDGDYLLFEVKGGQR